jgi:hypothetical protein
MQPVCAAPPRCRSEIKLSNVWCIYGYSLTIFIPMAFVCIVPIGWVRWLVVGLATGARVAAAAVMSVTSYARMFRLHDCIVQSAGWVRWLVVGLATGARVAAATLSVLVQTAHMCEHLRLHNLMVGPIGWVRWLVVGLATGGQMHE